MPSNVAVAPRQPFAEAVSTYSALLNTEELVPTELLPEYLNALQDALAGTRDEVEGVAWNLRNEETSIEAGWKLIAAMQKHLERRETVLANFKTYVSGCIKAMGQNDDGTYKKLEGHTAVLSLRKNPDAIDDATLDKTQVPDEFKTVTIEMPAELWARLGRFPYFKEQVLSVEVSVDKNAVKKMIKDGLGVPGARLRSTEYSLQVK